MANDLGSPTSCTRCNAPGPFPPEQIGGALDPSTGVVVGRWAMCLVCCEWAKTQPQLIAEPTKPDGQ